MRNIIFVLILLISTPRALGTTVVYETPMNDGRTLRVTKPELKPSATQASIPVDPDLPPADGTNIDNLSYKIEIVDGIHNTIVLVDWITYISTDPTADGLPRINPGFRVFAAVAKADGIAIVFRNYELIEAKVYVLEAGKWKVVVALDHTKVLNDWQGTDSADITGEPAKLKVSIRISARNKESQIYELAPADQSYGWKQLNSKSPAGGGKP